MDIDTEKVLDLRPDLALYSVGTLWVLAISGAFLSASRLANVVAFCEGLVAHAPHLAIPPFVIGFAVVLLGVVVPYCLAYALSPLSHSVMNLLLSRHLGGRTAYRLWAAASDAAVPIIQSELGAQINLAEDGVLAYLEVVEAPLAKRLRRNRQTIQFRGSILLPASLFVATIVTRLGTLYLDQAVAVLVGGLVAVGLFVVGALEANVALTEHGYAVMVAGLAAAIGRRRTSAIPQVAAVAGESQPGQVPVLDGVRQGGA